MTATFATDHRRVTYRGDKDLSHYTYELCDGRSQKVDLRNGDYTTFVVGPFTSAIRWINFKAGRDHEGRTFMGSDCGAGPIVGPPTIDGDPCPRSTPVRGYADDNYLYSLKLQSCPGSWVNLWYEPFVTTSYAGATSTYTIGHGFGEVQLRNGTRVKWNTDPAKESAIWWVSVTRPDGTTGSIVDDNYSLLPGMSYDTMLPMDHGELWEFARRLRSCAGPLEQPLRCATPPSTPTASLVVTAPDYAGQYGTIGLWSPQDGDRTAWIFASEGDVPCAGTAAEQHGRPGTVTIDASPMTSDFIEVPFLLRRAGAWTTCAYVADRASALPASIERATFVQADPRHGLRFHASAAGEAIDVTASAASDVERRLFVTVRKGGTECMVDVATEAMSRAVVLEAPGVTADLRSWAPTVAIDATIPAAVGTEHLVCAWLTPSRFDAPDLLRSVRIRPEPARLQGRIAVDERRGFSRITATNESNTTALLQISTVADGVACPATTGGPGSRTRMVAVGDTASLSVIASAGARRACLLTMSPTGSSVPHAAEAPLSPAAGRVQLDVSAPTEPIALGSTVALPVSTTVDERGLQLYSSWSCGELPYYGGSALATGTTTSELTFAATTWGRCVGILDTMTSTVLVARHVDYATREPVVTASAAVPTTLVDGDVLALTGSIDAAATIDIVDCDGYRAWSTRFTTTGGAFSRSLTMTVSGWASGSIRLCARFELPGYTVRFVELGATSVSPTTTTAAPTTTSLSISAPSAPTVGASMDVRLWGTSAFSGRVVLGVEERPCGGEPGAHAVEAWVSPGEVDVVLAVNVPSSTATYVCAYRTTSDPAMPLNLVATTRIAPIVPRHDIDVSAPSTAVTGDEVVVELAVDGRTAASVSLYGGIALACSAIRESDVPVAVVAVQSGSSLYRVRIPVGTQVGDLVLCSTSTVTMPDGTRRTEAGGSATIAITSPPPPEPTAEPTTEPTTEPTADPTTTAPTTTDSITTEPTTTDPTTTEPTTTEPDPLPGATPGGSLPGGWAPEPSGTADTIRIRRGEVTTTTVELEVTGLVDQAKRLAVVLVRRAPRCNPSLSAIEGSPNTRIAHDTVPVAGPYAEAVLGTVDSAGAWMACAYLVDASGGTLVLAGVAIDVPRR